MKNRTYNWKLIDATGQTLCLYEFTGRFNKVKAIRKDIMAIESHAKCTLSRVRKGVAK